MAKAGMFYLFETLGEVTPAEFYRQSLDEAVYGEELGFDSICPAEHHFSEHYGIMPRVELFLSWVAGRTAKMRLWPMLVVAPLRNPIQLAEDIALIDNFSQGRVVFSVGTGYRPYEFVPFAQNMAENVDRLREITDVCMRLFTEETVTHEGKFFRINGANLQPKPFQSPHPPVYLTTTRKDQIQWAAERGFGIVPAAGFNPGTLEHDLKEHAALCKQAGKTPPPDKPFFKWIYVHEDHKKGVEEGTNYILKTLMAFAQGGGKLFEVLLGKSLATWGDVERPEWLKNRVEEVMAAGVTYKDMVKANWTPFVCGDPQHVTEVLKSFTKAGANYFIGGFKCGPMPQEKVKKSMRLFAEKVLPNL